MASGIDWFRWHHGSVTDPKFQLVAKKSGATLPDVLAVWTYLLEKASAAEFRGCFGEIDCESVDCLFGFDDGKTDSIMLQMVERKLIADEYIVAWEKRQVKRERESDNSSDRVKAFREKQRHVTPCNANDEQETPREEKRREEETTTSVADKSATVQQIGKPPCPADTIIALYHELMPLNPAVKVLNEARRKTIRARWKEAAELDCAPFGYYDREGGIAAWRQFFEVCAESDFLTGKAQAQPGKPPFIADIDFLMSPSGFAKCLENKYHREAA